MDGNSAVGEDAAAARHTRGAGGGQAFLAESEARDLVAEQRSTLLDDARSHGPYLWTGRDVDNALLWFDDGRTGRKGGDGDAAAAGEWGKCSGGFLPGEGGIISLKDAAASNDNKHAGRGANRRTSDGLHLLLRRILQSRGVVERRPAKKQKRKKRRRRGDDGGDDEETLTPPERFRRLREETLWDRIKSDPPLRSVVLGYCHLEATLGGSFPSSSSVAEETTTGVPSAKNDRQNLAEMGRMDESNLSAGNVLSSGPQHSRPPGPVSPLMTSLRRDLVDMCTARARTRELYDLCEVVSSSPASSSKTYPGGSEQMQALDESDDYFSRPSTAIRIAYAAQLYDRLLELSEVDNSDGDKKGKGTMAQMLNKLRALALRDERIREVHVLLLIEPLRRLRLREHVQDSGRNRRRAIPPHEAEKACSLPPIPAVCASVIMMASELAEASARTPFSPSLWSLPSALLCAASQFFFPVARGYVHHLIDSAVEAHGCLYRDAALGLVKVMRGNLEGRRDSTDEKRVNELPRYLSKKEHEGGEYLATDQFDCLIMRLRCLCTTSDRLFNLFSDIFNDAWEIAGRPTHTGIEKATDLSMDAALDAEATLSATDEDGSSQVDKKRSIASQLLGLDAIGCAIFRNRSQRRPADVA